MSRLRRAFVFFLLPLPLFAAAASVRVTTDWRRRSDESIRARLLEETPLGSCAADVEALVKNSRWSYEVHRRAGFSHRGVPPAGVVGHQHIRANLGDYWDVPIPLVTNVTVFWGFDADGRLIDIRVWKTTDGR